MKNYYDILGLKIGATESDILYAFILKVEALHEYHYAFKHYLDVHVDKIKIINPTMYDQNNKVSLNYAFCVTDYNNFKLVVEAFFVLSKYKNTYDQLFKAKTVDEAAGEILNLFFESKSGEYYHEIEDLSVEEIINLHKEKTHKNYKVKMPILLYLTFIFSFTLTLQGYLISNTLLFLSSFICVAVLSTFIFYDLKYKCIKYLIKRIYQIDTTPYTKTLALNNLVIMENKIWKYSGDSTHLNAIFNTKVK